MRKLLAPVVLAGVALVASACDANVASYAAQVGGTTISQSELSSTLSLAASNPGYSCVLSSSGALTVSGTAAKVAGTGTGTYNSRFVASVLDQLIELTAVRAEVATRHLAVGAFARQVAVMQLQAALNPQAPAGGGTSPCHASGAAVLAAFPAQYREQLIELQADLDALASARAHADLVSPSGVRAYATRHGGLLRSYCVSLIPYKTSASASSAKSAIASGTSFSSLATTAGEQNGGALRPCVSSPSVFVPPLNTVIPTLAVGQVSTPTKVVTASGTFYVLLLVTSAAEQPLENDAAAILPSLSQAEASIGSIVAAAQHVQVAPSYGTWARTAGAWQVLPPSGPPVALIPNPAAVGVSGAAGATGFGVGATGASGTG